jgi:hypothetical protein
MARYIDKPFSLEVAFDGRNLQSNSPLFQLPFEILSSIIDLLPDCAFTNLASINSDWYLITRSRQFATVDFHYSQKTVLLIQRLLSEVPGHESTLPKLPPFGHCVRNATAVVNRSSQMVKFDRLDWNEVALGADEFDELEAEAFNFEKQIHALHGLMGSLIQIVLVRLEHFLWSPAKHFMLNHNFLDSLANSSIKNLSLGEFLVDVRLLDVNYSLPPIKGRSLERIQLGMGTVTFGTVLAEEMYSLPLIRLATNIRRLDLHFPGNHGEMSLTSKVKLPVLEELKLATHTTGTVGLTFLETLLPTGPDCCVRSLCVSLNGDETAREFFTQRGQILSLRSLIWDEKDTKTTMAVLRANTQLSKASVAYGTLFYLPILAETYKYLTTLSVVLCNEENMRWTIFEHIGQILSLEYLHLGYDEDVSQFSQRYWVADHNSIPACFHRLRHLRMLSFGFDIYYTHPSLPSRQYYNEMVLQAQVNELQNDNGFAPRGPIPTTVNPRKWEAEHKERMLLAADIYFKQHPNLNWLYIGQLVVQRNIWKGVVLCSTIRGPAPITRMTSVFGFPV